MWYYGGRNQNRTRLECKVSTSPLCNDRFLIRIEPDWNVKSEILKAISPLPAIRIEPDWNVKFLQFFTISFYHTLEQNQIGM